MEQSGDMEVFLAEEVGHKSMLDNAELGEPRCLHLGACGAMEVLAYFESTQSLAI